MEEEIQISVSVTEYQIDTENWLKLIKYVIRVTDSTGENSVQRSAKDFKTLRKFLLAWWPGCIIPAIPSEYSQKNPNQALIPSCLNAHNIFLNKIIQHHYFAKSQIVEAFLKDPSEFSKATLDYKIPSYSTIAENFENNFKENLEYQTNVDTINKLQQSKEKFGNAVKVVENLEKIVRKNCRNVDEFKKGSSNMVNELFETEKWLRPEVEEKKVEFGDFNPGHKYEVWLIDQLETLYGAIEAIGKIDELVKVREMIESSINSTNLELQKLALGKKTLATLISNKEDVLKLKQHHLDDLNAQLKALDIIIPVISSKLFNIDIPSIEQINTASFERETKNFLGLLAKDLDNIKGIISNTN